MEADPTTPDEVCEDLEPARYKPLFGRESAGHVRLPVSEGGCGLASAVDTEGEACLVGKVLVLARAPIASSRTSPSGRFDELLSPLLAKDIIQEVTSYAKGDLVHTVRTSWAAVTLGEDPPTKRRKPASWKRGWRTEKPPIDRSSSHGRQHRYVVSYP